MKNKPTKSNGWTPTSTKEALIFYNAAGETLADLIGRWADEKEFEDIKDYQKPLNPIAEQAGVTITKMTAKPFGCQFTTPNGKLFKLTMTMKGIYAYKEMKTKNSTNKAGKTKSQATAQTAPKKPQATAKAVKSKPAKPKAAKPAKPAQLKSDDAGPTRTAYIDGLILKGGLTSREIAEKALSNFSDSTLKANLTIARSRPWHLKKKGLVPMTKKADFNGKTATMKTMLTAGTYTCEQIAAEVVKRHGGDLDKTKVVVRSMPWHMNKQGMKGSYVKLSAVAEKITKKVTKITA